MDFVLTRLPEYSDEALIAELQRVAELVQHPTVSRTEFLKHSRVHSSTIEKRFGSWKKALLAASLLDRFDSSNETISNNDIIAELQRVSELLGVKTFSKYQFNSKARFTDAVVRRGFGTWHKAMKSAGLIANKLGQRYTDEECFENLLQVWTHYGRQPQHREMTLPPSEVGPKAYVNRWGAWTKALYAFVQRINADLSPVESIPDSEQYLSTNPIRPIKSKLNEHDKRDIKLGLRYAVFSRDRFKCVICGNSPAISIDCRLHVDHIYPFSKGGKTVIENLRTLCLLCNLGKSNRIE